MDSNIKLQYTEIEEERNAILKQISKKIYKKRIFSILNFLILIILSLTLKVNNWVLILFTALMSLNILSLISHIIGFHKTSNSPASKLITLFLKTDGFTYEIDNSVANFSYADVDKLEPLNKQSLIVQFKKRRRRNQKNPTFNIIPIYSNAFNDKITREQFIEIFNSHLNSIQTSNPIPRNKFRDSTG